MRKISVLFAAIIICFALVSPASAARVSPALSSQTAAVADAVQVGTVIVAFNTNDGLKDSHLSMLSALGITRAITYPRLGMVALPAATAGQVRALAASSAVRSVWDNERIHYYDLQARTLTGVERVRTNQMFRYRNDGWPISGKGDFSVLVIDSGVDATHDDLKFGQTVIQNVQVLTSTDTVEKGFTPVTVLENVPNTDQTVGHGTHCAGIIGGTGQRSGGKYAGVAPGTKIIGAGLGAGLFVLNAVGAWEWALANQYTYNIKVVSNSYGSFAPFDPDNPINIASRSAYDNGITVVFAGANSGPGKNTYNKYAKAPWVIGVAAGTKEGGLAGFSSRGTPADERFGNNDPLDDFDAPTITAPGTGREFESNAAKFSAAYVSTRSTSNLTANGLDADAELAPGEIPFYTQISGTSMAAPYVAGVIALMLDADSSLQPDEIKQIITETATRMPGYADHEVGAGYINAYAAVDKVFNRTRVYNAFNNPNYNAKFTITIPASEPFHIDFNPASTPGANSPNAKKFTVQAGMSVLDVYARVDTAAETGDGNLVGLLLTSPNGTTYSSGIQYPVIAANSRGVIVQNPLPGEWVLEVRGARSLAAAPGVSLPTSGAAAPGPVDGIILQKLYTLAPVADLQGHTQQEFFETLLKSRRMDTLADGYFHPEAAVTREDFARTLLLNAPVRQTVSGVSKFTDVSGDLAALAESLTASGSTLRDWNFAPAGLMSASGTTFNPNGLTSRLDLAVAFVRALGLDTEARALAGTNVTSGGITLSDNAQIPTALRGYVQLAIDKGFLEVYPAEIKQIAPGQFVALPGPRVEPANNFSRAALAAKVNLFAQRFAAGN
ncbi:MAG TPA: S8 family serine peptidase [Pyrinomonadaceae bacterium]|jgi:serine protease AprX|nr:S8 family serine peptidase [Pyrinomonadaceae bacterium]